MPMTLDRRVDLPFSLIAHGRLRTEPLFGKDPASDRI